MSKPTMQELIEGFEHEFAVSTEKLKITKPQFDGRLGDPAIVLERTLTKYLKYHTSELLQTLQRELLAKIPTADVVTTKYGYNSDEKKYGYRIGTAEAVSAIKEVFGRVLG